MMRMFKYLLLALGTLLTLAACDSLPRADRQAAKQVEQKIDALSSSLEQQRAAYATAQQASDWNFYNVYAKREGWSGKFDAAELSINDVSTRYATTVKPLLKENKSATSAVLQQELSGIRTRVDVVQDEITFVEKRMGLLRAGNQNADKWAKESRANFAAITATAEKLVPVMQATQQDFPERSDDIATRYVPIKKLQTDAQRALEQLEIEYANRAAKKETDYAAFADAYTLVGANLAAAKAFDIDYRKQLQSLSQEYTTVLRDMRVEYWLKPQQETWCDYIDCVTNTNEFDWVAVSKADYETYATAESLPNDFVKSLGLNPEYDLGGSRGGFTWYAEDAEPRYFHKLATIEGTKVTEGDWEAVDEEEFAPLANAFGMAIETKKLGMFADEAVSEVTPPGIEMVGDERYGRWETNAQGQDRWSFLETYAMYHLLFGSSNRHYYSRAEYDSYNQWRRNRRDESGGGGYVGWYGASRSSPSYGSDGSLTQTSASYKGSSYGQAGGANSLQNSVRNAGATARARGPGSSGK